MSWLARKYRKRRDKLSRKKSKIVIRLLAKTVASDPSGARIHLYSRLLSWLEPDSRVLPLSSYADASQQIGPLAGPCEYLSETPRCMDNLPLSQKGTLPATMGRLFFNARVTGGSSAVSTEKAIAVPTPYIGHPHAVITDAAFLVSQENGIGIVRCPEPRTVPKGIAVFGSGASNWYHWLIEILPAAFLAERLPAEFSSFPLLVPDISTASGSFQDSTALFAKERPRIAMPAGVTFQVKKLVLIDPVVNGPMNLRAGQWPEVTDYSQNAEVLLAYRAAILDRLGLIPARPTRRIFLARSNDRRSFNQADLIAVAERYDFEIVYPELMTFREQVRMYAESEILLGASGAAFANMLFCQPGTKSLTWLLPQYSGFCAYSNLANVVGVSLNYLFVTPLTEIKSSYEAYSAAYTLSPSDFEVALKRLI